MTMGDLDDIRLDPGDALFLDFDGTLAELGPDPDAIWLPEPTPGDLDALALRIGGAIAVLSGRDLRDLAKRVPSGVWRLGGHGIEVLPPGAEPPPSTLRPHEALLPRLSDLEHRPGVRIEVKGPVVAIHYRAAPEEGPACLAAAESAARAAPDHVMQAGKMVVEVKPAGAHKGAALRRLMEAPPFAGRRAVMLGDDTTDEDAMRAAIALGGIAVKVGSGETDATFRAPDPQAVRAWLSREAAAAQRALG